MGVMEYQLSVTFLAAFFQLPVEVLAHSSAAATSLFSFLKSYG